MFYRAVHDTRGTNQAEKHFFRVSMSKLRTGSMRRKERNKTHTQRVVYY